MLLIKLFSRTFITKKNSDDTYTTIVIREIPKYIAQNQIITVDANNYLNLSEDNIADNNGNIKLKVTKIIKKYIYMMRSKRRKRCTRRIGYTQYIGYFKLLIK